MDKIFEEYLNNLTTDCLSAPAFAIFSEEQKQNAKQQLETYFSQVILDTLIDNLSEEQLNQLEKLNPTSPEALELIQTAASVIPNFAQLLEDKLKQEADQIKSLGQIPSV